MANKPKDRLVSIKRSDLESLETTLETLQNKEAMEQLEKSDKDIEKNKVRNVDGFLKELNLSDG